MLASWMKLIIVFTKKGIRGHAVLTKLRAGRSVLRSVLYGGKALTYVGVVRQGARACTYYHMDYVVRTNHGEPSWVVQHIRW